MNERTGSRGHDQQENEHRTGDKRIVFSLSTIDRAAISIAGGKAANLGELTRAGFPVPRGFTVSTAAYSLVAESTCLEPILTDIATTHPEDSARVAELAATARERLLAAPVPTIVVDAISAAYRTLGNDMPVPVAVRSSATAEDLPEATFAGQQDTFLNVVGIDAVIDAVRRCWASLWSDRAAAYRARQGLDQQTVKLAVVVQRMVPAEVAGVLFTANPVTGARDEIVVDASPGLGEAVVSGLVTPDHFVLRRRWWGWSIAERRPGRREVIVRARSGGSTEQVKGSASTDVSELPDQTLRRLARLGATIERHFGRPQDIEWAWAGGDLFIVQARPITALPEPAPRSNKLQRRMSGLFAEMLPIRPYPLDVTVWMSALFTAIAWIFVPLGLAGPRFDQAFVEEDGVVVRFSGRPPVRLTPGILLAPIRLLRLIRRYNPVHWHTDPLLAEAQARARALEARDLRALSWDGLLTTVREAQALPLPLAGELRRRYMPRAALAAGGLWAALRLLGRGDRFAVLLSGVENKTLEANRALEALAARIRSNPTLADAFARYEAGALWTVLEEQPPGQSFLADLRIFLDCYGHREMASALLVSQPTWKDAPEVVLAILKGLALAEPRAQSSRPAWQGARDELLTLPLLRFPLPRSVFLKLLAEARCLLQIREDTHFYTTLPLPVIRRTLLEFGRRLVSGGVLSSPENVFHLKLDELEQVDGTWPPPPQLADELRTAALRRKQRRAALEGTPLIDPRLFRRTELDGSVLQGDVLLRGTPGSPGVAEGPVRIIRDGSEFGKLCSGEVLVAPYTNPAWTPLFQRAAAVVVDGGGAASHAAIVAREYGIPAVMGTVEGTQKLTDGQRVMVDGDQGRVTLLSKAEA
jgi:phosphohistidine swiveling domain-containing protein